MQPGTIVRLVRPIPTQHRDWPAGSMFEVVAVARDRAVLREIGSPVVAICEAPLEALEEL